MLRIALLSVVAIAIAIAAAIAYGQLSWRSLTREAQDQLNDARERTPPGHADVTELDALPDPVRRYFRAVLQDRQPLISTAIIRHHGDFNMGETTPQWKRFSSEQYVVTRRPGFVWDARIRMAPKITVHVHDAFIVGRGVLRAKLFGLVSVMRQPSTPELAQGELMRFLAEAPWYPTALLPSQGVRWQAVNDSQALAVKSDEGTEVRLLFTFDAQDLITTIYSEARYRDVGGRSVPTPWQGRFWNYQQRSDMLVPLSGEVAWLQPEGPQPYWRGNITDVRYESVE